MEDLPPPPDQGSAGAAPVGGAAHGAGDGASGSAGAPAGGGTAGAGEAGASAAGGGGSDCPADCDCDGDMFPAAGGTCGGDDCDDNDPDVRPDQQEFFEAPRQGGGWDYDCDTEDEPEGQAIDCSGVPSCETMDYEGFITDGDLDCGARTEWGHCTEVNMLLCTYDATTTKVVVCH